MNPVCRLAAIGTTVLVAGCNRGDTSPAAATPAPTPSTAAFTITFGENPVPFRSAGCNGEVPQGWYTTARVQETAGVSFTPATLTQKLDGGTVAFLSESFESRFGACGGAAFTPGTIAASGAVCGVVGICTTNPYRTYQFEMTGTDANGHAIAVPSPLLQLAGSAGSP
jgi:hypothetical protein